MTSRADDSDNASKRSDKWRSVWDGRAADLADWNGMEKTFSDKPQYDHWLSSVADFLSNTLQLSPQDDVLDLGCGTARIAERIATRVRNVTGFDYSESVLAVARARRMRDNLALAQADLNQVALERLACTKAYAVGVFLYLDSRDSVFRLLDHFQERSIPFVALDLPDEALRDARPRDYDRSYFDHLSFSREELLARYPNASILDQSWMQGYVNGALRFTFVNIPARGAR